MPTSSMRASFSRRTWRAWRRPLPWRASPPRGPHRRQIPSRTGPAPASPLLKEGSRGQCRLVGGPVSDTPQLAIALSNLSSSGLLAATWPWKGFALVQTLMIQWVAMCPKVAACTRLCPDVVDSRYVEDQSFQSSPLVSAAPSIVCPAAAELGKHHPPAALNGTPHLEPAAGGVHVHKINVPLHSAGAYPMHL